MIIIYLFLIIIIIGVSQYKSSNLQLGGSDTTGGTIIIIDDENLFQKARPQKARPQKARPKKKTFFKAGATAILNGGKISHVNIINVGKGYNFKPCVQFIGGGGEGAKAIATVDNGQVVSINLISGGKNYNKPPKVKITCRCPDNIETPLKKAEKFNEIIKIQNKEIVKTVSTAKKQWKKMEKHIEKDNELTKQADELGLPPPPPIYTDEQLQEIQDKINIKPKTFTVEEKSMCMDLLNRATVARTEIEIAGKLAADEPGLRAQAIEKGKKADKLWEEYRNKCSLSNDIK